MREVCKSNEAIDRPSLRKLWRWLAVNAHPSVVTPRRVRQYKLDVQEHVDEIGNGGNESFLSGRFEDILERCRYSEFRVICSNFLYLSIYNIFKF